VTADIQPILTELMNTGAKGVVLAASVTNPSVNDKFVYNEPATWDIGDGGVTWDAAANDFVLSGGPFGRSFR
jgi:hypothetical protein